jgi:stage II sporulation protein D
MPKLITRHHKFLLLAFLILYFLAGQPPEFGEENLFFQGYPIAKPVIRIALGLNVEDIQIRSSSGMKIYQVSGAYKLLAEDAAEARVRGRQDMLSEKFLVQTGQFRKREDADAAVKALREKVSQRVTATQDGESGAEGVFHVRAGDFLTRSDALAFIKKVTALGIRDAWIIREEVSAAENHPRWVTVNDQLINLSADSSLYFIPASTESYLSFGNRNYRGIFVLRGSRKGLVLVNILNVEEYLKGVVPGELPPSYFNELEAQKAQAIAARTYALKNLGQYNDLGFDLLATPASQVYLGLSAESPLSSRAVEETRGEVAVYGGKLINALYMSTCGGVTEDVEAMFDGGPVPYLKSTECIDERDAAWTVKSPLVFPLVSVNGRTVSQNLAYLAALGVLPLENTAEAWKEPAETAEMQAWAARAAALLGKKTDKIRLDAAVLLDFPALARLLADDFGWKERVDNLMLRAEADRVLDGAAGLKPEERGPLAYFIVSGIYPASENLADRNRRPTKAEAAYYLYKVLATYKDFSGQGTIHDIKNGRITVHTDGADKEYELTSALLLLRELEGSAAPTASLDLEAGDVVKWVESESKVRLLQIVSAPVGNVLDYTSQFHRWQSRISRDDLEARLNQYYPIGRLIDVIPGKRGASRRVLEMTIVGQESQVQVRGLKIRQVLNLRDNLFVVDRQPAADGRVAVFVFSGKGWGHGVGLCQVGAFRMAQKGASYEEILKKYYRGISLRKMD